MIPNRFVIIWDNEPVGLDSNSGGYPYKTQFPGIIKWWATRKKAENYMSAFPVERNWHIVEIQFRIV